MVLNWTVLYFSLKLVKFLTKCFYEYKQEENKSFNSRLLCLTTMSLATKSKTELKIWWCRTMSEELLTHFLGQMENKQSILKQTDKVAQIGNSSGIVTWQYVKTSVWHNQTCPFVAEKLATQLVFSQKIVSFSSEETMKVI